MVNSQPSLFAGNVPKYGQMSHPGKFFRVAFSGTLLVPIILISLYLLLIFFIRGSLPTSQQIVENFASLYSRYGYEIIFIGAFLEALLLVNFVVPGALAVSLGAVFSRSGQVDLAWTILAAVLGAMLGFIIDFTLGYFGFGKLMEKLGFSKTISKIRSEIDNSWVRSFGLGFVHPNLGAFVSFAAGSLEMNFGHFIFLAALSTLSWYSFWGLLIFALGDIFLTVITKYGFVLFLMFISLWILINIIGRRAKR